MSTDTRSRILDAALAIMTRDGLAAATTKQIARAAGCSEAALYKHFESKQAIFVQMLAERIPSPGSTADLVGTASVRENLEHIVGGLLGFYVRTFPLAASIFGSPALLREHQAGITKTGGGPRKPVRQLQAYLDAEVTRGRLPRDLDTGAVATLLSGAAFHQAFFACFESEETVPDADALARALVSAVLPATAGARSRRPAGEPERSAPR